MNGRVPHLSPLRLLAGLVVPLVAYLIIRALIGSSVALGRRLLLVVAESAAKLNPDRPELAARLAEADRRRAVAVLTTIIAATFAIDGASQTVLALTVPTASFVADSTAARIAVLGTGAVIAIQYLRDQKERLDRRPQPPTQAEHDR